MKTKRKYFYLDDYEHRLLVGCLVTARNEYIHEDKPIEDVNELILKIIDACAEYGNQYSYYADYNEVNHKLLRFFRHLFKCLIVDHMEIPRTVDFVVPSVIVLQ